MASFLRSCTQFSGRMSKPQYWHLMRRIFFLPAIVIAGAAIFGLIVGIGVGVIIAIPVAVGFAIILAPLYFGPTVRRLHDTGNSTFRLKIFACVLTVWLLAAVYLFFAFLNVPTDGSDHGFTGAFLAMFGVAFTFFWGMVTATATIRLTTLCEKPGVSGSNRYGPDPFSSRWPRELEELEA